MDQDPTELADFVYNAEACTAQAFPRMQYEVNPISVSVCGLVTTF